MRLDFFRRNRWAFFHPRRDVKKVMAVAALEAGSSGIDSLDLLVATLDTPRAARVVKDLGGDPRVIEIAARGARASRDPRPGLTDDAKAVVEAVGHRAILARADWDVQDLLVALATADCLARQVLNAHRIDAAALAARAGGPAPS